MEQELDTLRRQAARLESIIDQLKAEFDYLDGLMREVGFEHGLITVRLSAQEILLRRHDPQ